MGAGGPILLVYLTYTSKNLFLLLSVYIVSADIIDKF